MRATVAIPTYDRPEVLSRALGTVSAPEVLVVDDGSKDAAGVRRVAEAYGARYVRQPHGGVNVARNTAVRESSSDLIAFIDDDVEVHEGWLDELLKGAERYPEAGVFGGPVLLWVRGHVPHMCERETLSDTALDVLPEGPTDRILGGNMLIRREVWEQVGPFDPRLNGPNDDTEWLNRVRAAGYLSVHMPSASVWHVRTTEDLRLRRTVAKGFRYGRASVLAAQLLGQHPTFRGSLRPIPRYLGHAVRARCTHGMLMAARSAGTAVGTLTVRWA